jgi:hypothetical protein
MTPLHSIPYTAPDLIGVELSLRGEHNSYGTK